MSGNVPIVVTSGDGCVEFKLSLDTYHTKNIPASRASLTLEAAHWGTPANRFACIITNTEPLWIHLGHANSANIVNALVTESHARCCSLYKPWNCQAGIHFAEMLAFRPSTYDSPKDNWDLSLCVRGTSVITYRTPYVPYQPYLSQLQIANVTWNLFHCSHVEASTPPPTGTLLKPFPQRARETLIILQFYNDPNIKGCHLGPTSLHHYLDTTGILQRAHVMFSHHFSELPTPNCPGSAPAGTSITSLLYMITC